VTAANVQRVAKTYLVKNNRTVGVLVPTGVLPHEESGMGGPIRHAPVIAGSELSEVVR
jgi:hypothetical protein